MAVEVAIAVCTKIAEYTVKPILNPIIRPFKYLWEYRSNLESLSIKMQELETKVSEVQGFTIEGANRLQELQDWHDKVSRISNEVEAIPDPEIEPESMTCGQRLSYSTLKQSYLRRKDVARALEKIARLNKEATRSENEWKDKSNFHNLMKAMENLEAVRDERKSSIKEGEEALPDAKKWLGKVDDLIVEISNTIRSQPPTRQCCKRFTCLKCYDRRQNVDCKLNEVGRLLEEGRRFEEFSCPAEETKYKRSLDDLKKEVEKLKVEKHSEELSGKDGNLTVHLWRNNVDKINDKVSHLDEDYSPERIEEVVRLRKEVVELFEEAKGLTKAKELKDLSIQLNSEEPWSQSIKSLPPLESRISILEEIMVKLQEPDVSIVGIWGLGGIGKTTLAKQVAIQAMEDGIFDKYVFVEVSASPDVKNIQEEIGCKLAFSFQHKDHIPGRARELHQRLKNAEKTLLVFDNIWEGLNFERLGIPCKDNQKGLKLLMTGRDQNVLNDGVEPLSSYNFRIETLEWEDAWSLFRSKANVPQDHFLAIEVARECGGVPIAIVTLGSALSNKEDYVWRDTLRELREPSADSFDGIAGPVYQSIALSYNHLKSDKLKETFLLCSSMPNTNDSSVEDLWRYGVSLGLFSSCKTLEEERDNVLTLLSILKSSSLLVDAPDHDRIFLPYRERFAMHDVVCDVARSIAQKKEIAPRISGSFIPPSSMRNKWFSNCTHITLYDIDLSELLPLKCLQLRFLYLRPKSGKYRISNEFFESMCSLEVLHLIDIDLLSTSLAGSLMNLQMLCLKRCILEEIGIGDLKNLKILSFENCQMSMLPEKFFHLSKLQIIEFLDDDIRVDLTRFVSSFKRLEALYIGDCDEWKYYMSNNGSTVATGVVLEYLTSLVIRVPNAEMLKGVFYPPQLKRYDIRIGGMLSNVPQFCLDPKSRTGRFLQVRCHTDVQGIISKFQGIKRLVVDQALSMTDYLVADQSDLEYLRVHNNSHIFSIFQKVSQNCLSTLVLWNLENLKTICNGPIGVECFPQLRTLRVGNCKQLTHIFLLASDKEFQQLEEIYLLDCENIKVIFAIGDQVNSAS